MRTIPSLDCTSWNERGKYSTTTANADDHSHTYNGTTSDVTMDINVSIPNDPSLHDPPLHGHLINKESRPVNHRALVCIKY